MPAGTIPPHLSAFLSSPATPFDAAVDALEEWISYRRSKGDNLFEVSVGLAELEAKTPPHISHVFDRARYVCNVPEPHDLTPPMGPFPLARSASPSTIVHHLLSDPTPPLEHSREVILEYVLGKEQKWREKKPGRGGKGTLGRDAFEEISKRLTEVEDGLKGAGAGAFPTPISPRAGPAELDEAKKIGMTLILSLRMSLSYFTLQELADQLILLGVADAERTLVQHIRRRVGGEGRWGVGKELELVEDLVVGRRPVLRPAFRSAKTRTTLPQDPYYQIPLPAPSKSSIAKLILGFAKDVEEGRVSSSPAVNPKRTPMTPTTPNSPKTPSVPVPMVDDPNPIPNYALELVSEYLAREKREYMLKAKWAKSGRDQLGKDLGDIEAATCTKGFSPLAPKLLPVFLVLRRTFALPSSPLPANLVQQYMDLIPAPPDPDDVPFREPTVQSTTVALYVNPRLDDSAAQQRIDELVDFEKEKAQAAGATDEQTTEWIVATVEDVEKRFPDGSYAKVFAWTKANGGRVQPVQTAKMPHRRVQSTAHEIVTPVKTHNRSLSMPMRGSPSTPDRALAADSDSDSDDGRSAGIAPPLPTMMRKDLPPLQTQMSPASQRTATSSHSTSGWWDVVSAVDNPSPWRKSFPASNKSHHSRNSSAVSAADLPLPPGAEPAQVVDHAEIARLDLDSPPIPRFTSSSPGSNANSGYGSSPEAPINFSRPRPAPVPPPREPGVIDLGESPPQPLFISAHSASSSSLAQIPAQPAGRSPGQTPSPGLSGSPLGTPSPNPSTTSSSYNFPRIPVSGGGVGASSALSESPEAKGNHVRLHTQTPTHANALAPTHQLQPQQPLPPRPPAQNQASTGGKASRLFGRNLTRRENDKSKHKEEKKEREREKKEEKGKTSNEPARWNKDMVASIMGPSAARR